MKAPEMNTRIVLALFCLGLLSACASRAHAERPRPLLRQTSNVFDVNGLSPDDIIERMGLKSESCLQFVDETAVQFRKERWLAAIHQMWRANPEVVTRWVIGDAPPPQLAREEAERQKNCMIGAMVVEAADSTSPLVLDWGDEVNTKARMPEVLARFEREPRFRHNLISWITRSDYRDAREQSYIWHRKFIFQTNPFNRVSPFAAQRCALQEGRTWDPGHPQHQRCWKETLSTEEREREILGASAAPGISRHHWGSDFDLFSLNPRNFIAGARMNDEYRWIKRHGVHFGFVQPYTDHSHPHAYMEERWHWSYLPLGQALTEFIQMHTDVFELALHAQWDRFESRWNSNIRNNRPFFQHVRAHWRDYMFHVDPRFGALH